MSVTFAEPVHPGEYLREEYLEPLGLSPEGLAVSLGIAADEVEKVVAGETPVTADMAARLSRHFGTSPHLWLNFQRAWDLR